MPHDGQVVMLTAELPGCPDAESRERRDNQQPDPSGGPDESVDRRIRMIAVEANQHDPIKTAELLVAFGSRVPA